MREKRQPVSRLGRLDATVDALSKAVVQAQAEVFENPGHALLHRSCQPLEPRLPPAAGTGSRAVAPAAFARSVHSASTSRSRALIRRARAVFDSGRSSLCLWLIYWSVQCTAPFSSIQRQSLRTTSCLTRRDGARNAGVTGLSQLAPDPTGWSGGRQPIRSTTAAFPALASARTAPRRTLAASA